VSGRLAKPRALAACRAHPGPGQHPNECYDRVNFDLNGPDEVGYFVDYVTRDQVVGEGEGASLSWPPAVTHLVTLGAQQFCAIRSYLSTAAKQGRHFFDTLVMLAEGRPWLPATQ
jgi:hypothetical protein